MTDPATSEVRPVTIVTDNGGPFRSARLAATIDRRPELGRVRPRARTPGQNGVRERGFESLKYKRLYREHITDGLVLVEHAEAYRLEYNTVRPHEALSWNRLADVHRGFADPAIANFDRARILPSA